MGIKREPRPDGGFTLRGAKGQLAGTEGPGKTQVPTAGAVRPAFATATEDVEDPTARLSAQAAVMERLKSQELPALPPEDPELHPASQAATDLAHLHAHRSGATVPPGTAVEAVKHLHTEGDRLEFPDPDPEAVRAWFDEADSIVAELPQGALRNRIAEDLEAARAGYEANPKSLTGAQFYSMRHVASLTEFRAKRETHPDPVKVAIDLDGCVYDFNTEMRNWLVQKRGWDPALLPEPDQYNLKEAWGIGGKELGDEMAAALREDRMFGGGPPMPEAHEHIRELGLRGHRIIVNSARALPGLEVEAERATIDWMRSHDMHPDYIHFVSPGNLEAKSDVEYDIIVDDYIHNVKHAMSTGRLAFLFRQKWSDDDGTVPGGTYAEIARIINGGRTRLYHHFRRAHRHAVPIPGE